MTHRFLSACYRLSMQPQQPPNFYVLFSALHPGPKELEVVDFFKFRAILLLRFWWPLLCSVLLVDGHEFCLACIHFEAHLSKWLLYSQQWFLSLVNLLRQKTSNVVSTGLQSLDQSQLSVQLSCSFSFPGGIPNSLLTLYGFSERIFITNR